MPTINGKNNILINKKKFNAIALRMTKPEKSFGHSECNRVKVTCFSVICKGDNFWDLLVTQGGAIHVK